MYDTLHKVINKLKHLEMHELIHVMEKYYICKKTIDFYQLLPARIMMSSSSLLLLFCYFIKKSIKINVKKLIL